MNILQKQSTEDGKTLRTQLIEMGVELTQIDQIDKARTEGRGFIPLGFAQSAGWTLYTYNRRDGKQLWLIEVEHFARPDIVWFDT